MAEADEGREKREKVFRGGEKEKVLGGGKEGGRVKGEKVFCRE